MFNSDPTRIASVIIIIYFAIGLHEYAHCKFADMAGDPTPGIYGRVTLNLFKHFEPIGTLMMFISSMAGVGMGWGRPAPMNPDRMRNPRWDFFIAVIAGPLTNVVQAVAWAFIARLMIATGQFSGAALQGTWDGTYNSPIAMFFILAVIINLSLAAFNMIPLGPLDGHWILGTFMPEKLRLRWYLWNRKIGMPLLIVLIVGMQLLGRQDVRYDYLGRYLGATTQKPASFLLGIKEQTYEQETDTSTDAPQQN